MIPWSLETKRQSWQTSARRYLGHDVFLLNMDSFIEQGHYITMMEWDKIKKILWLCLNTDKCKNSMKTTTISNIPSFQLIATATSWIIVLDSLYSTYKIKGITIHSHKTPLLPESNQSRTDFISLNLPPNHLTQAHNV